MRGGGNSLLNLCDLSKTFAYKNPHLKSQPIVIARFGKAESWQSTQKLKIKPARSANPRPLSVIARALPEAIQKIKSFCFVWLSQKVESLYPLDSNPQNEIPPIRSYIIYFSHCLKLRDLDTSLRINATLSMTNRPHLVILMAIARSIHFGDSRIALDLLTLGESMCLNFTRFTLFGLLRRLQRLAMTIRRRFTQSTRFATFHTTHKGIKMNT